MSQTITNDQTPQNQPSLSDCLKNLQKALADVVCHQELSDGARSFLIAFCDVITQRASEDIKNKK